MSKPESGTAKYLYEQFVEGSTESELLFELFSLDMEIAEQIYSLREKSGITQKELANLVGTTQSVISRLEDVDYSGHSVSMLQRIATALGYNVKVLFIPITQEKAA